MKSRRIPVWLVTGYLGSGKTTLLAQWLRDHALHDAALVVNEIGEVTLDDKLLAQAVDSATVIGNACICCTGLPGLEETLVDLWWDRLHRRRPAFGAVVIETTGLADPWPIVDAFDTTRPLGERYELAAIITTASASAGPAFIASHPDAQAQIRAADVVVITKLDRADGKDLADMVRLLNPDAGIALSANASVHWPDIMALQTGRALERPRHGATQEPEHHHHHHDHHPATAQFLPLTERVTVDNLREHMRVLQQDQLLLRVKGVAQMSDGSLHTVQWAAGDPDLAIQPFTGPVPPLGLTCIQMAPNQRRPSAISPI